MMVLIVEDDADLRDAYAELLLSKGIQVALAGDGAEALNELRGGLAPDVVLLDLLMPGMSGLDFRREQIEAGFNVPAVVVTGDNHRLPAATRLALLTILPKPVKPGVLIEALRTAAHTARRGHGQRPSSLTA